MEDSSKTEDTSSNDILSAIAELFKEMSQKMINTIKSEMKVVFRPAQPPEEDTEYMKRLLQSVSNTLS
jgi:hypothetical protein